MSRMFDGRPNCKICRKKINDDEIRWSRVTLIGDEFWTHDTCERKGGSKK